MKGETRRFDESNKEMMTGPGWSACDSGRCYLETPVQQREDLVLPHGRVPLALRVGRGARTYEQLSVLAQAPDAHVEQALLRGVVGQGAVQPVRRVPEHTHRERAERER